MKKHVNDLVVGNTYYHTVYKSLIRINKRIKDGHRDGVGYEILSNPPLWNRGIKYAEMYEECPFCQWLIDYKVANTPLWKVLNEG